MKAKKTTARTKKPAKKSNKQFVWLAAGLILIAISLLMGSLGMINSWLDGRDKQVNAQALVSNKPAETSEPLVAGKPTRIDIDSVNIDLEVIPGYYNSTNNSWTLTLNKAQWGTMTAQPNNKEGQTFIYAHYRLNVFYTLPKVKVGDIATVATDNGHIFKYKFRSSTVVSPDDASVFNYKGKPILVLQTCTGVWYEKRQLFVFDFVEVN